MPQSGVSLAEDNAVATRSICGRGYYRSKDCRRGHQNAETTFFFFADLYRARLFQVQGTLAF